MQRNAWVIVSFVAVVVGFFLISTMLPRATVRTVQLPTLLVIHGQTMGSTYSLQYSMPEGSEANGAPEAIEKEIGAILSRIEATFSHWQENSELARFNASQSTDWVPVSPELIDVIERSQRFTTLTDGKYDVTIGSIASLWGFGPSQKFRSDYPESSEIDQAKQAVGLNKLELKRTPSSIKKQVPGLQLDLSSIVAGYAADAIASRLIELGVNDFFLDITGEIVVHGNTSSGLPWRVGIEKPEATLPRKILAHVELTNEAIATSANHRNGYMLDGKRIVHTLDASTGLPFQSDLLSATVIAKDCLTADALSTALMLYPPDQALALAEKENACVLLVVQDRDAVKLVPSSLFAKRFPQLLKKS